MNEKKFTYIIVSLAAVAILVVILLNIPWGGEKAKIRKEFGLDNKDHVYEYITYDSVLEKIDAGESFQLFVGDSVDKLFAITTNDLAKQYGVEVVHYLNLLQLSEDQLVNLTHNITASQHGDFPSLYYFGYDAAGENIVATNISGLKELEDYQGNYRDLLTQYFKECYED